ncbi:MAG: glycosyltransferase [Opitutus sp.]|nr:glycosyltransferase [Opitutus sp.]
MAMWPTVPFSAVAAILLVATARLFFHLRWVRRLPAGSERTLPVLPRVSVVVAARDEEARIETTIRRLLAQRDVVVDVIAVDDRSTDATGQILRRIAEEDARLSCLRVETLPDGWLGKCHACHLGAGRATGDWILFTDADCWMKPDVIARALAVATKEGADHVTLTPGVSPLTAGAGAWHLLFLMSLAGWIAGVNRDRPGRFLGIGSFNLMRASAYRTSGGYATLRLTVLDDVKLGRLLQRTGHRTRAFIGGDDVQCHWGTALSSAIRIMEKNYFAAIEFRFAVAVVVGVVGPLGWLVAVVGPFTGSAAGVGAGLALLSTIGPATAIATRLTWRWRPAVMVPFVVPLMPYALLRSAVLTVLRGGVSWRSTFYSLERLRAGRVR